MASMSKSSEQQRCLHICLLRSPCSTANPTAALSKRDGLMMMHDTICHSRQSWAGKPCPVRSALLVGGLGVCLGVLSVCASVEGCPHEFVPPAARECTPDVFLLKWLLSLLIWLTRCF